jgi:hypothetical protein
LVKTRKILINTDPIFAPNVNFNTFVAPLLELGLLFPGDVAQLVEQRTENPCVGGSIPSVTTLKAFEILKGFFRFTGSILTISLKLIPFRSFFLGLF